jgi:uncharacterized protein
MQPPATPTEPEPQLPASAPAEIKERQDAALDLSRIAQSLQIRKVQVENAVQLLDEGNTIPFITRYCKERTGGLNEDVLRLIQARVTFLRQLADRRTTILRSIEGQGKLTDALKEAILAADSVKRLEDLYLPYKPKRRSLATAAKEKGLEPLATAIWERDPVVANLAEVLAGMVDPDKGLATVEDVLAGVGHIWAERFAETVDIRAGARRILWETGKIRTTKSDKVQGDKGQDYKDYFDFSESAKRIPPHRILAINRGEKEGILKIRVEFEPEPVRRMAAEVANFGDHPQADLLAKALQDALDRLLLPSLEREIRSELTDEAEEHAVKIFARNLKSLLMQPPLRGRRVLAIDPGFRTGCKLAALSEVGEPLAHGVAYLIGKPEKRKPKEDKSAASAPAQPAPAQPAPAETDPGAEAAPAPAEAGSGQEMVASATSDAVISQAAPTPVDPAIPAAPAAEIAEQTPDAPPTSAPEVPPEAASDQPAGEPASPAEQPAAAAPAPDSTAKTPPAPEAPSPAAIRSEAKSRMADMIRKHNLNVVAIGNGTACRETEELTAELISEQFSDLAYVIVNEAGASVYSASPVGREEFPDYDATLRGTISIGRRLQDPLSELVKIEPQNIGVGLYQQDIEPKRLKESLDAVVESCVNQVGVDLNTASVSLLRHVSGLNQLAARELVDYRRKHGPFRSREQLLEVPGIGPARFTQAAGFLKIVGGDNPLDETWVHPESYAGVSTLLGEMGIEPVALRSKDKLSELSERLRAVVKEEVCNRLSIGMPTFQDICQALIKPGRDPREDLPPPIFKKGILKLDDLQPGMELKGTVLNVVDFGAFVDVGLKDSGLVHISQMSNRFIRNPYEVVAVGDIATVWVLSVDRERQRVSLTMIQPGTERKPPERGSGPPPRQNQGQRREQTPGQHQHQDRNQGQGRPQGRRPGPPPRQGPRRPAPAPQQQGPPPPPPRPRKPARATPKPNLSQAALEGEAPLRTFSELKAFFEAQKPTEATRPKSETPAKEPPTPSAPSENQPPPGNQP